MKWSLSERLELGDVIAQVDSYRGLRSSSPPKTTLDIKFSEAEDLKSDLAASNGGALLVRHVLKTLGLDERRLLGLRLEHKLVQAHLLEHYCPGVGPVTLGATQELAGLSRDAAQRRIDQAYEDGFCLKSTLGAGGKALQINKRPNASALFGPDLSPLQECPLLGERFVFQKEIAIAEEYRIHSIEDSVIPNLTYLRHTPHSTDPRFIGKPESFVQEILDALPSGITRDSFCGWDIAIDGNGKPIVIEVNYAGIHTVYRPGFQCSGFFHTRPLAVPCLGRLMGFAATTYGVRFQIELAAGPRDKYSHIYWLVNLYTSYTDALSDVSTKLGQKKQASHSPYVFNTQLSYEENLIQWSLTEIQHVASSPQNQHLPRLEAHVPPPPEGLAADEPEHDDFFRKMLNDVVEPTDPFNLLGASSHAIPFEEATLRLASPLVCRLREIARESRVELSTLIHVAWGAVVARTSDQSNVVFTTVFYGTVARSYLCEPKPYSNGVPIRILIDDRPIEESVQSTHALLADLTRHQQASMSLAHRCSGLVGDIPLSGALLNYRKRPRQSAAESRDKSVLPKEPAPLYAGDVAFHPISLAVDDADEEIALIAHAPCAVGALRICELTQTALHSLADMLEAVPHDPVSRLEPMSIFERDRLLYGLNQTLMPLPTNQSVHGLFEGQARDNPEAIALEYPGGQLTYSQLNSCANRLAHRLRTLGIGIHSRIALCLDRGPEMLIALLAVLKAGGTYIPLDPAYPIQRLRLMLEDSAPAILLTQHRVSEVLNGLRDTLLVLNIDLADSTAPDQPSNGNLPLDRNSTLPVAQHLAYIIYTSGSTGIPKGVQISHSSLLNFLVSMQHQLGIRPDDVFLAITTISFDIAALEIFLPLIAGARVRLADRETARSGARLIREIEAGTTFVQATPTSWKIVIEAGWQGKPGLKILCGGEPLDVDLARKLVLRSHSVWNMYGPTETTIWSLMHKLERSLDRVSIGRPIANTQVYILNHFGNPVPVGVQGELCIGGAGVSTGYLNQPELTSQRFAPNLFLADGSSQIYRTGDLARWLPDGTVEFLGRNDSQVKLQGFRIELGEIEARLAEHSAVRDAVILVREDAPGARRLVAYYTPADRFHPDPSVLRAHLSAVLPDYMVPAFYMQLDTLPSTLNGKLDRAALPPPAQHTPSRTPSTPHEDVLCSLFAEILDLEAIGIDDDFFDLGGNSLLAFRLLGRIQTVTGVFLSIDTFFANPTVARLVESFNPFSVSLLLDPSATDSWL